MFAHGWGKLGFLGRILNPLSHLYLIYSLHQVNYKTVNYTVYT